MTVGYFAPLPPAPSGVADHAAALLHGLRGRLDIAVGKHGDISIYHVGNNPLHREIYFTALRVPGIAVLHDAVLHHLLMGCLSRDEYLREFVYNYGEWRRELAGRLWDERSLSAADERYFKYPMLRRLGERSLVVIVHNPAAARMVLQHAPNARVVEIPLLAEPSFAVSEDEAAAARKSLSVLPNRFLFGVFGYLRPSKRIGSVAAAFRRTRGAELLLAGAGDFHVPGAIRVRHTPQSTYAALCGAVDACINLRYPSAGESSSVALRAMLLGQPAMLTATQENARFTEGTYLPVTSGLGEPDELAHYMMWLISSRAAAAEIGRRAADHVRRNHLIDVVVERYVEVIRMCLP
jgi:glycosyltransferase involved in cell wall biosynthesis